MGVSIPLLPIEGERLFFRCTGSGQKKGDGGQFLEEGLFHGYKASAIIGRYLSLFEGY